MAHGGPVIVVLEKQHANLNLRTQASQRQAAVQSTQAPVVTDIKSHGSTDVTGLVGPDPGGDRAGLRFTPCAPVRRICRCMAAARRGGCSSG